MNTKIIRAVYSQLVEDGRVAELGAGAGEGKKETGDGLAAKLKNEVKLAGDMAVDMRVSE